MLLDVINQRCIELFFDARVQALCWPAWLFWQIEIGAERGAQSLKHPSVDLYELEVLLAAVVQTPSWYQPLLDRRLPNRSAFLRRSIARGRLPILTPCFSQISEPNQPVHKIMANWQSLR